MAASRPIWKGQLRLSLVSINVEMFPAHKSGAKTAFNQIHAPTGKRIHYQKVVDGVGPVDADDIKKGYEYEKGEYVLLEDEELDAVKLETKKTLDLVQFVDEAEIPPLYYDSPYFVAPADDLAEDAFRVVRDALRKSKKVGLGQLALGSLRRSGLRAQTRLAVLAVAGPELVEPAAADAGLPAQPGHRRLPALGPVDERLPQACQTVRRGHGRSSAVDCNINSVRVVSGPLSLSAVSGFTVGCKV